MELHWLKFFLLKQPMSKKLKKLLFISQTRFLSLILVENSKSTRKKSFFTSTFWGGTSSPCTILNLAGHSVGFSKIVQWFWNFGFYFWGIWGDVCDDFANQFHLCWWVDRRHHQACTDGEWGPTSVCSEIILTYHHSNENIGSGLQPPFQVLQNLVLSLAQYHFHFFQFVYFECTDLTDLELTVHCLTVWFF